jgi:hypothetical protein
MGECTIYVFSTEDSAAKDDSVVACIFFTKNIRIIQTGNLCCTQRGSIERGRRRPHRGEAAGGLRQPQGDPQEAGGGPAGGRPQDPLQRGVPGGGLASPRVPHTQGSGLQSFSFLLTGQSPYF